jgi:3-hydroxybutyryl-CoA dehydrogenase
MAGALPQDAVVAVIGAGAMGAGIAQVAALHGHRVQLHDARFGAADEAVENIRKSLARQVAKSRLTATDADTALQRITTVVTLPDTCVASLIIEAIVEDRDAKRELFAGLEDVISAECILASNTSSLSIAALGSGLKHPGRVVGMHFFNPVPLMPLVEVVTGPATDATVTETVFATAAAWGKTPVHAASTPGFIVNRCARPFYGEALRLLAERAADPATIDAVMREAGGFRMGPFELMDLIGHDVNFAVTRNVWEASFHDPRFAPSVLQEQRVAAGFLGRKSGRGFYDYAEGIAAPTPRAESPGPKPARIIIHGDPGICATLVSRVADAGVAVDRLAANARLGGFAWRILDAGNDVWLALSDGRTATARAVGSGVRNLTVFDLAFDYAKATRLAVARADTCSDVAFAAAVGALQAAGLAISRFDDVAGLAVLRTVAMLANEAADAIVQGVAAAEAVDLAMEKGVNYPRGPLAWADAVGIGVIRTTLLHLAAHYGEDRYRLSPLIARRALTGEKLSG